MDKSIAFICLFISRQGWCILNTGIIRMDAIIPGLCSAGEGIQALAPGKHCTN